MTECLGLFFSVSILDHHAPVIGHFASTKRAHFWSLSKRDTLVFGMVLSIADGLAMVRSKHLAIGFEHGFLHRILSVKPN
jgi:hypothetical protein